MGVVWREAGGAGREGRIRDEMQNAIKNKLI